MRKILLAAALLAALSVPGAFAAETGSGVAGTCAFDAAKYPSNAVVFVSNWYYSRTGWDKAPVLTVGKDTYLFNTPDEYVCALRKLEAAGVKGGGDYDKMVAEFLRARQEFSNAGIVAGPYRPAPTDLILRVSADASASGAVLRVWADGSWVGTGVLVTGDHGASQWQSVSLKLTATPVRFALVAIVPNPSRATPAPAIYLDSATIGNVRLDPSQAQFAGRGSSLEGKAGVLRGRVALLWTAPVR